jgi:hypothetical protein
VDPDEADRAYKILQEMGAMEAELAPLEL